MKAAHSHHILALTPERALLKEIQGHLDMALAVEIIRSEDSLELIERYARGHLRLIILDVEQLAERALRLISIVREIEPACQILLFAPPGDEGLCAQVLSLGAVSCLVKPISASYAASLIGSLIGPASGSEA